MTCSACKSAPKDGKACRYCGFIARDARLERLADDLRKPEPDRERIEFIRRAAIAIYVGPVNVPPQDAWRAATELWGSKPDDC